MPGRRAAVDGESGAFDRLQIGGDLLLVGAVIPAAGAEGERLGQWQARVGQELLIRGSHCEHPLSEIGLVSVDDVEEHARLLGVAGNVKFGVHLLSRSETRLEVEQTMVMRVEDASGPMEGNGCFKEVVICRSTELT